MKLALNPEYVQRHLFVTVLLAGLSCWFGYDAVIRYPATPAAELYRSIEKSDPPEGFDLEGFKDQKTKTQYGFAFLSFLVSAVVGTRLAREASVKIDFDDEGFTINGTKRPFDAIKSVDRSRWEKKGIVSLRLDDGGKVVLDSWHRLGVKEFEKKLTIDPSA